MKVNFAAILDFLIVIYSTKLTEINHTIVNIVSGMLIVTVNIAKKQRTSSI